MITFRREARPEDLEAVREIIVSTGFFYDIEVPVALELLEARLEEGEKCDYHFVFADLDGRTVSYSCFGPIAGTDGSYDLYWIATHNDLRGKGIGYQVIEETHRIIREMGGRLVIAETSTLDKYAPTRHFYDRTGYTLEARIDDFYREGDGKVFFVKRFR
ncbi:MAG TPA: GNAT family N-acetyltransferase [Bacteroidales bacterium]|nr:GNAT family N-acetyltransferase [Bacteroidales bacterium]